MEELYEKGHTLLLLGTRRDLEGVLFKVPRLNLPPLGDDEIRSLIWSEAERQNILLTSSKAAELASRAGGNPMLAQRLVLELKQGVKASQDGANYRDITPFLLTIFGLVGAVRFVGMATGNLQLRVLGGLAITLLFSFRSLLYLFPKGDKRR